MLERTARIETLRAGAPVSVGSITLLPIERVVLRSDRSERRVWFTAAKEPYALIVRDESGIWAIDANAVAVPLEALRAEISGLDAALATL
jgi:hypothetical protein